MSITIPERYRDADFQRCEANEFILALRAFLRGAPGKTLLLDGPTGSGKSFAVFSAYRLMQECAPEEYEKMRSVFADARIIATSFFQEYSFSDADRKRFLLNDVTGAGLLVIDNLGNEAWCEENSAAVESILDTRYQEKKSTILTTSISQDEFETRYGAHTLSRIIEDGARVERHGSYRKQA